MIVHMEGWFVEGIELSKLVKTLKMLIGCGCRGREEKESDIY